MIHENLILNPDKEVRTAVIKRMRINGGYCPCTPYRDMDHTCPCKDAREHGVCHCQLYVPKEN